MIVNSSKRRARTTAVLWKSKRGSRSRSPLRSYYLGLSDLRYLAPWRDRPKITFSLTVRTPQRDNFPCDFSTRRVFKRPNQGVPLSLSVSLSPSLFLCSSFRRSRFIVIREWERSSRSVEFYSRRVQSSSSLVARDELFRERFGKLRKLIKLRKRGVQIGFVPRALGEFDGDVN